MDLSILAVMICQYLIGLVLLMAGLSKVMPGSGLDLRHTLGAFGVPFWLVGVTAHGLPLIEIICGASLLAGLMMPIPALIAASLLTLFAATISLNLIRGNRPSCSCFGVRGRSPIGWSKVIADGLFVTIALFATGAMIEVEWRWPLALAPGAREVIRTDAAAAALISMGLLLLAQLLPTAVNLLTSSTRGFKNAAHNPSTQPSAVQRSGKRSASTPFRGSMT